MPPSYALSLEQLREPQQGSPISHPYNTYPKSVEAHIAVWDNEMRTYTYVVAGTKDEGVVIKQIFTGNSKALQVEATELLKLFQLHIPMQRKIGRATSNVFCFSVYRCINHPVFHEILISNASLNLPVAP